MALQSGERPFSIRQCQPDRPGRAFGRVGAAHADLMRVNRAIAPGQLHHHPPFHPALPPGSFRESLTTPRFWTVS